MDSLSLLQPSISTPNPVISASNSDDLISCCFKACETGVFEQVKTLIIENPSLLSQYNHEGYTLFHICAITHQLENMEWLYEQNSSVLRQLDSHGRSAMHLAAEKGDFEIVRWLNQKNPKLIHQEDHNQLTPLHLAAFNEHIDICKVFIHQIKNNPILIQQIAQNKCVKTLALLLENKVDPNTMNSSKQTLLHLAAEAGQEENVECLLQNKAKCNILDLSKRSPLFLAVAQGHRKIVHILIKAKASLSTFNEEGETLVHLAAFYGHLSILKDLLRHNRCKSLINTPDNDGKTPLHKAMWGNPKPAIVRTLLENKADPIRKNNFGYTSLHWAAKHGHWESAVLIGFDASEVLNENHHYPLDLAIRFDQDNFIHSLLGTKKRLKIASSPSQEDREGFYFKSLHQAKKHHLLEEQILYLMKLSALYVEKAEETKNSEKLLIGAKILNCAIPLLENPKHSLVKNYLFGRLAEIERLFLKNQGIDIEIKREKIEEVRAKVDKARKKAAKSHQKGIEIQKILYTLTNDFKAILKDLIAETQELIGPAPVEWSCIGMGSMSRNEMCPYSDLEFAFLIEEETEGAFKYFRTLSKILELRIVNVGETKFPVFGEAYDSPTPDGFCLDNGGNTPLGVEGIYELIGTPWKLAQFQSVKWMERNIILPNALSNVCLITGSSQLINQYNECKEEVQQLKVTIDGREKKNREELAKRLLDGHLIEFSPDLSKEKEKETAFGVKKELYRPFQEILGCLALLKNLKEKSTLSRIDKLVELKVFSPEGGKNLKNAINKVLSLRLQTHLFYKDEKEFLCHPEKDKPQNPSLYYFNEDNIKDLQEIYRSLFPFHKCSSEFFLTGNENTFSKNSFYDDSPLIIGKFFIQTMHFDQAKNFYQNAISLDPNNVEALLELGNIEAAMGNFDEHLERHQHALKAAKNSKQKHEGLFMAYIGTANALSNLGRHQEALDCLEEGKKEALNVFGANHPQTAFINASIGETLIYLGKFKKSLKVSEKTLAMLRLLFGENHLQLSKIYLQIGICHHRLKDLKKSLKYLKKSLAIYERFTRKDERMGVLYTVLGTVLFDLKKYAKAEKHLQLNLRNTQRILGPDRPAISEIYMHLGRIAGVRGNFKTVMKYLEKALAINIRIYGEKHPAVASCYKDIGSTFLELRDNEKGKEYLQKGFDIASSLRDQHPLLLCEHYFSFAHYFFMNGDFNASLDNARKALDIALKADKNETPTLADIHRIIGISLVHLRYHSEGLVNLEKSLEINKNIFGENHAKVAVAYSEIATIYQDYNMQKCIEYNQKALEIGEKTLEKPGLIPIYCTLGDVLISQSRYDEAIEINKKALSIAIHFFGEQHHTVASCYRRLSGIFFQLKDLKKGIEYAMKTLEIREKILPEENPDLISGYVELAILLKEKGEIQKAIVQQQQAIVLQLKYIEKKVDVSLDKVLPVNETLDRKVSLTPWLAENDPNHQYQSQNYGVSSEEAIDTKKHLDLANYYFILAELHFNNEECGKAIENHYKALELRKKFHKIPHLDIATSYNRIGMLLAHQESENFDLPNPESYKKAIENFERAIDVSKKLQDPYLIQRFSENLGNALRDLGEYNNAIAVFISNFGYNHPAVSEIMKIIHEGAPALLLHLDNEGQRLLNMGQFIEARLCFLKSLKLRKALFGEEHIELVKSYDALSFISDPLKKPNEAIEYTIKALEIRLKVYGEKHPEVVMASRSIALAYEHLYQCDKAIEWWKKTSLFQIKLYGEDPRYVLESYLQASHWLIIKGEYEESKEYCDKTFKFLGVWGNLPTPEMGTCYSRMGTIHNGLGNNQELENSERLKYYHMGLDSNQKALQIRWQLAGNHADLAVAKSYCMLAYSYHGIETINKAMGNPQDNSSQALDYHQRALSLRESAYQYNQFDETIQIDLAESYEGMGITLKSMGKESEAQQYFEKSLAIMQKIYPKDYPLRAALEKLLGIE